jgi:ankyrin repeat protein
MSKAALKKELREIDRQLARFGVLIENIPSLVSEPIPIVGNRESFYDFALGRDEPEDINMLLRTQPITKSVANRQRNTKCKIMRKRLQSNDQYNFAKSFDSKFVDPILRSKSEKYVKCHPDNIYGQIRRDTYPYLWPLLPVYPENYRYIGPIEFFQHASVGTLTLDEIFMFTMVHDIDTTFDDGVTALMTASRWKHTEKAAMLINHGADVNRRDNQGRTALTWACRRGYSAPTAAMLIDHGANVAHESNAGETALLMTIMSAANLAAHMRDTDRETARLLLDRGADVNQANKYGKTPLMLACEAGLTNMAAMLIDHDANVAHESKNGATALMVVCQYGHTETAKLLLERGANVDYANKFGTTALMAACQTGHTETAAMLLEKGANIDHANKEGRTALMKTCLLDGHTETAAFLINNGANITLADNRGNTAMDLAIQNGHVDIQTILRSRL